MSPQKRTWSSRSSQPRQARTEASAPADGPWRALLAVLPHAIFILDESGRLVAVNAAAAAALGARTGEPVTLDDAVARWKPLREDGKSLPATDLPFSAAADEEPAPGAVIALLHQGHERYRWVRVQTHSLPPGLPGRSCVVLEDVSGERTALREVEAARDRLRQEVQDRMRELAAAQEDLAAQRTRTDRNATDLERSRDLFREFADHTGDLIFRYRLWPERGFEYVNPAATAVTGYTPEEHYANPDLALQVVHADDRHLLQDVAAGAADLSQPLIMRWVRKDGRIIWMEQRNIAVRDGSGRMVALHGVARDITERVRTEEKLRESERFLQTVIDTEPECVKLLARDGTLLMMNRAGLDMIDAENPEQVQGRSVYGLVTPEYRRDFTRINEDVFNGVPGTITFEAVGLKGRRLWLETRVVPLRDDQNEIMAALGITRDVTARKRSEEMLRNIAERISTKTGDEYFQEVTKFVVQELGTDIAFVGEILPGGTLRTIALFMDGAYGKDFQYDVQGTPCENVIGRSFCFYSDGLQALFPRDAILAQMGVRSYAGIPLFDTAGAPSGALITMGRRQLLSEDRERIITLLQIFAGRAAAELERRRNELQFRRQSSLNANMADLAHRYLTARSIEEITALTLDSAKTITGSAFGYVGYIDPATGYLVTPTLTRDIWDRCEVAGKSTVFEKFNGLWGWVLTNRRPLMTNAPASDPRSSGAPAGHIPITRFLSVPSLHGDQLVGQIALANADRDYTDQDLEAIERLAAVYALGVTHKQTEDHFTESRERFRVVFENAPDAVVLVDTSNGVVLNANPAASRLLSLPRDKILGIHASALHPERMRPSVREAFAGHVAEARTRPMTQPLATVIVRADGTEIEAEVLSRIVTLDGGEVLYEIIRDITERRQAETALHQSEQRYRQLLESITSYLYTVTVERGRAVATTHGSACLAVTGYRSEEYAADPLLWYRMVHDEDKPAVLSQANLVLAGGRPLPLEHRLRHKNGSIVWVRNTIVPRFDASGALTAYDGIIEDISERKRSELFVKNILESIDEGFIIIDRNYRIVTANRAYLLQLGRELGQIVGEKCYAASHRITSPCFEHGEDCAVRHAFVTGQPSSVVHTHHDSNGNPVIIESKAFPLRNDDGELIAAIEIIHNITDRKRLEDQLRHAQKMEAVGLLAGGIAHDFNNILTAIVGYGNLLKMKVAPDDPSQSYADQILSSAARAANLTQSLLAFSRKQVINPRPMGINEAIRRVEKLLQRIIGEDVTLRTGLADGDMTIMADSGQVEQVLMNLVTNARDAMPDGGTLTISTGVFEIGEDFIRVHGFGAPGTYARASVADTGTGMAEETRSRIFEPFFTTKEMGKGTGLGLSIVYGIMKQNGGYVTVESSPGRGSVFHLYFPLIAGQTAERLQPESETCEQGHETVLVAEDDESIRRLSTTMLTEFGYTVIEATDGEDAVRKFREHRDSVKLVILDVVMPRMGGKEAAGEIAKIDPGAKIMYISGYNEEVLRQKGIAVGAARYILKPVSPMDLLRSVRQALDEDREPEEQSHDSPR